jgi:hypothetical protein
MMCFIFEIHSKYQFSLERLKILRFGELHLVYLNQKFDKSHLDEAVKKKDHQKRALLGIAEQNSPWN